MTASQSPDWPTSPGHRLKLMGEIMWDLASKTTTQPSARAQLPLCSKAQRLAAKLAATCRAARIAIGGYQRSRAGEEAWPLRPENIHTILENRGPDYTPPRLSGARGWSLDTFHAGQVAIVRDAGLANPLAYVRP